MIKTELVLPQQNIYDRNPGLKEAVSRGHPGTVVLIPDGNRRWARQNGLSDTEGHLKGIENMITLLPVFIELPSDQFVPWVFAHDNWKRPKDERDGFMQGVEMAAYKSEPFFLAHDVRFLRIGREDRIQKDYPRLWEALCYLEERTKDHKSKLVAVPIDYSGRDQTIRMIERYQKLIASGQLPLDATITPELEESLRDGGGLVRPADLIIRTSGEQRTSDLGWLGENAEFYTTPTFLPDLGEREIVEAFIEYPNRARRLGGDQTAPPSPTSSSRV